MCEFDGLSRDELIQIILDQRLQITLLMSQVETLTSRVAELEKQLGQDSSPDDPPAFLRPNRPARVPKERKKRGRQFFRRRDPHPTDVVMHVPASCPDCGRRLEGGWVHRRRQIIDIEPSPVKITEHVIYARRCGVCGKRVVPRVDMSGQAVGKSRVGIGLTSLIAYMHTVDQILVSDFYGGYNRFACSHQRCWVHLLRDLHKLKDANPTDAQASAWVDAVIELYRQARHYQETARKAVAEGREHLAHALFARQRKRREFEQEIRRMAEPYVRPHFGQGPPTHPQSVLAERCVRFAEELFTFVEHPQVPSENNAAERAIRPAVIARKISGGTRSAKGSQTKATLMSLFGTWQAQHLDPMEQCRLLLAGQTN